MTEAMGPMPIKLKRKFTASKQSKNQKSSGGNSGSTKSGHHKISAKEKERLPPQPKMAMVMVNGRTKMIRLD